MDKDTKKFFIRSFIFSLPIISLLGISTYILWISGELISLDKIVNKKGYFVAGLSYGNPLRYVKLNTLIQKSPQIIVMGSSRVSLWRDKFFNEGLFYNAYVGGNQIEDYLIFLKKIPTNKQPKVIFVGFDSDLFDNYACPINNSETIKNLEYQYTKEYRKSNGFRVWKYGYTQIYKDYFTNRFKLKDLKNTNDRIGLNALVNGNGFRNDGSYLNNKLISELIKNPIKPEERLLKEHGLNKVGKISCSDKLNYSFDEVDKFLKEAKSRGIYVVGFLTPYARIILKNTGLSNYKNDQSAYLGMRFNKYGYNFYNFSDPDINRGDLIDDEMIDPSHGSEKTGLRMLLYMLENESKLEDYANINYLKKMLTNSKNNFFVFEQ